MEGFKLVKRYRSNVGLAEIAHLLYGRIIPIAPYDPVRAWEMFELLTLSLPDEVKSAVYAAVNAVPDPRTTGELAGVYACYREGLIEEAHYEIVATELHRRKMLQAGIAALSGWLEKALLQAESYIVGVESGEGWEE